VTDKATIVGADKVAASLKAAADKVGDLSSAGGKAAELVASAARQSAPRLTGALAASTQGFTDGKTTAGVGSDLVYAPVIHNGWSAHNIVGDPYITQAFESTEDQWTKFYDAQVADIARTVRGA
jgi:hypothetical protein